MALAFETLRVAAIRRETPDAVSIAFDRPEGWDFAPGQYLTLETEIGGAPVRRSYSICSGPNEAALRVGVKRVNGGRFSTFANETLAVGDAVRVARPDGRFRAEIDPFAAHRYLLVAAGSGVTPMLSIASAVLEAEPDSVVTLVYGNRTTRDVMFLEELEDLKDRHLGRFRLLHCLSREPLDVEALSGRVDGARLTLLASKGLIEPKSADAIFLCGPGAMIDEASAAFQALGVPPERIRFERFAAAPDAQKRAPSAAAATAAASGAAIETIVDGVRRRFEMGPSDASVLEAAQRAGVELPFSCNGGMCCTCRAKQLEGESEMAACYSLEPWEREQGFVLACQLRPTTKSLVLDFDAV